MEWKEVPGFPGYEASDTGLIRGWHCNSGKRRSEPKLLASQKAHAGHLRVLLMDETGKRRAVMVHRAVLFAFVGPCPDGEETRHLDGNPANNNLSNIVWGTKQANHQDKVRHGTVQSGPRNGMNTMPETRRVGTKNGRCKLTEPQVKLIKFLRLKHGVFLKDLSEWFGVSIHTVHAIETGKLWKHVA